MGALQVLRSADLPDDVLIQRQAQPLPTGQCGKACGVADVASELPLAHLVGVAEGEETDLLEIGAAELAVRVVDQHPVREPEMDPDRLGGDEPEIGRPLADRDAVADQVPAGTHAFYRVRHAPQDNRPKTL